MAERIYSVGIYARLSVEGGSRKNESIETQIEIAKEYMREQGGMALYGCYTDLGRTGTDFERAGFKRLMEDVKLRRVDCVIVKDFSRFGRNYIETGNYIQKIFPFLGVRFVAVTDFFDSLYAEGDDVGVNLKNLANEMYARDIALKVKSSKRAKREAGSYTGGVPPYGCLADRVCGRRLLSADAGAAEVVREIFDWYDEGRSLREIAVSLYAQEIHRPTEYRLYRHLRRQPGEELHQWPRTSLKAILTNSVYGGYEAIVSPELFCRVAKRFEARAEEGKRTVLAGETEKVQERLSEEDRRTHRNQAADEKAEEKDILNGVLFCGCCGRKLGRRGLLRRSDAGHGGGNCHYFCRNSMKIDGFGCDTGTISGDLLTEMVKAILRQEAVLNDITPEGLAEENKKCAAAQKVLIQKRCDAIQKKLRASEWEGSEQYQRYREGTVGREAFLEWRAGKEREREKLRESLEREKRRMQEADAETGRREILLGELGKLSGRREPDEGGLALNPLLNAALTSRSSFILISSLIERIDLYPDKRVKLTLRFVGKTGAEAEGAGAESAEEAGAEEAVAEATASADARAGGSNGRKA